MHLEYFTYLAEQEGDDAFTKGERINWEQFQINLAAHAASTNNPLQRLDAIMWLGIAGHPQAPTMAEPVRIQMSPNWEGGEIGDNVEGAFAEGFGIGINSRMYPDLNTSGGKANEVAELLGHELRHRGFSIIAAIPNLLSRMPSEYRSALGSRNSGVAIDDPEHSMIYAMDGISVDDEPRPVYGVNDSDVRFWRGEYAKCNQGVREWLADQPIPRGAPEALRQDLERIYGKPVEFVEPEETPQTPPEAVEDGDAVVIVVPPRIADQAEKPDLSDIRTTRTNTLARQGRSGPQGKRGVEKLQQALNYLGASPQLDVDGIYGPATRKAVRDFQTEHNLQVDGLAGPETMGKLRELLGQEQPTRTPEPENPPADEPETTPRPTPTPTPRPRPEEPIDIPQNIEIATGPGQITTFRPWRDELRAAGYRVSPSGKYVRTQDWATVAGIEDNGMVWFGNRVVRNIVKGHQGAVADTPVGQRPEDNIYIDN